MKHVPRVKQETSVWHAKMEGKGLQCLPRPFRTVYHGKELQMFSKQKVYHSLFRVRNTFVKGPFLLSIKVTRYLGVPFLCLPR